MKFMEHQRNLGRQDGKDLLQDFRDDAPEIVKGYIKRNIGSPRGLVLVLEDEDCLQGYMLSRIDRNIPVFKNEWAGYVSDIYLEEKYRGKGSGTKMWKLTLDWFKEKGVKEISIKVLHYNPDAFNSYKKWGFRHVMNEMRVDL